MTLDLRSIPPFACPEFDPEVTRPRDEHATPDRAPEVVRPGPSPSGVPAAGHIRSKAEFYRLWRLGLLGNKPRTWQNADALRASDYRGLVTMRSTGAGGGRVRYRVPVLDALASAWPGCTFNEACPDDRLLIQGEAARLVGGLCLTYSTTPGLPMREAMRSARTARGAAALAVLAAFLAPSSRDDLDALWDLFPDAVIEFGAYECAVGDQPHRNTLIWEVRNY